MAKLNVGDKWGALECIEAYRDVRDIELFEGRRGIKYHEIYTLKCDCGNEFQTSSTKFLGRRRTVDCGCGKGFPERNFTICASLKQRTIVLIDGYLQDNQVTRSAAIDALISLGWDKYNNT